ncbi:hypothetical protein EXIGLDRAFT_782483 [Exidia glandulosa HHB12029]|uniref:DRBM domain-containing protein n=1 Tax=Exidia glandulosa HHB12029 TaxID=1314781 RepID=A0A165Z4S3_EXIGL|nr:hypothetical protein EXIGLDRAFT_782483 [Exidia glandulosa HHB12029]
MNPTVFSTPTSPHEARSSFQQLPFMAPSQPAQPTAPAPSSPSSVAATVGSGYGPVPAMYAAPPPAPSVPPLAPAPVQQTLATPPSSPSARARAPSTPPSPPRLNPPSSSSAPASRFFSGHLNHMAQVNGRKIVTEAPFKPVGEDHMPQWTVCIKVDGVFIASGTGSSKADAKEDAARNVCEKMGWMP